MLKMNYSQPHGTHMITYLAVIFNAWNQGWASGRSIPFSELAGRTG